METVLTCSHVNIQSPVTVFDQFSNNEHTAFVFNIPIIYFAHYVCTIVSIMITGFILAVSMSFNFIVCRKWYCVMFETIEIRILLTIVAVPWMT